ncbi:MAG: hypothetical protein ACRD0J_01710, partial [Acidimicrobiales bacterium]
AVLASALAVAFPGTAFAKCDPHRANNGVTYFTGWHHGVGARVGGTLADIANYSPWVYPGQAVYAWVMITIAGSQWAQIGWEEQAGGYRETFIQWTTSPHVWHEKDSSPSKVGSLPEYKVLFGNPGPNDFSFYNYSTGYEMVEPAYWTPTGSQQFGEIHTLADQMPGGVQDPEVWRYSQVYYNGGWYPYAGTAVNTDPSYFNVAIYSVSEVQAGDAYCQY